MFAPVLSLGQLIEHLGQSVELGEGGLEFFQHLGSYDVGWGEVFGVLEAFVAEPGEVEAHVGTGHQLVAAPRYSRWPRRARAVRGYRSPRQGVPRPSSRVSTVESDNTTSRVMHSGSVTHTYPVKSSHCVPDSQGPNVVRSDGPAPAVVESDPIMETIGNPNLERGATPDEQRRLGCEPERRVVIEAMLAQLSNMSGGLTGA